jgi:hypothetical protein
MKRVSALPAALLCLAATACGTVTDDRSSASSAAASSMTGGPGGASSGTSSTTGEGGAGASSGTGGADDCAAPKITVLASKQEWILSIALDDTYVYWGTQYLDGNWIRRMPKAGGVVTDLLATQGAPWHLTVDATRLYWAESTGSDTPLKTTIYSMDKSGGASVPQVLAITSGGACTCVSLDQDQVYWSDSEHIYSVPKSGKVFLSELLQPSMEQGGYRHELVANHDRLYWLESEVRLESMPRSGGVPDVFATMSSGLLSLAMDQDRTYLAYAPGEIKKGQLAASPTVGGPETILVADAGRVGALTVGGSCVYWTTDYLGSGHLRAVPKIGGDPVTLAQVDMLGQPLAADGSGVYWGDRGTHQLLHATK